MDARSLATRFHEEMLAIYASAKTECRYNAVRFLQMVSEVGGLRTAQTLLAASDCLRDSLLSGSAEGLI